MFILTTISDVIQIEPADFTKPSAQALEDNINEKYANKVIQKVGLCICFYDLLTASEGLIGHGEGAVNVKVEFRLVVFRPFKGEVIEGIITESTPYGLRLHIEFFDDITTPPTNLFDPSHFDHKEATWIWTNMPSDPDHSSPPSHLHFDRNERVRFRVEQEIWQDQAAEDEGEALAAEQQNSGEGGKEQEGKGKRKSAWRLVASMQQSGLGVVEWW